MRNGTIIATHQTVAFRRRTVCFTYSAHCACERILCVRVRVRRRDDLIDLNRAALQRAPLVSFSLPLCGLIDSRGQIFDYVVLGEAESSRPQKSFGSCFFVVVVGVAVPRCGKIISHARL